MKEERGHSAQFLTEHSNSRNRVQEAYRVMFSVSSAYSVKKDKVRLGNQMEIDVSLQQVLPLLPDREECFLPHSLACVLLELDGAPTGTATTMFSLQLILALNLSENKKVLSVSGSLLCFQRFFLSYNTKFYLKFPIQPHLNTNIGFKRLGRRWEKTVPGRTGRPLWVVTCI